MNIKQKMILILVSVVLLSITAFATPITHDTNSKIFLKTPVAAFTAFSTSGYAPLKVVFTDKSTEKPISWKWNFGDGTSSTTRNPVHTYYKAGKYTVTLSVKNRKGSNKITKYDYIIVLAPLKPPVAAFTASQTSGYSPLSVVFTDTSTGTPTSWYWNFGDGTSSREKNPAHIYNKERKYTVALSVKNGKGSNKIAKHDYIIVLKSVLPVANFSTNISEGYAPLYVQFTDHSESANGVSWDFDSNGVIDSTDRNPIHEYAVPGTYKVNLTAVNAKGTNSTFATINVLEKSAIVLPVANFSVNVTKGYSPLTVQFTDLSENATGWNWDFGDSTNSADKNPMHTYGNDGIYNVTLTAKNADRNTTTTKYSYITVDSTKVVDVVCMMKIYRITAKYTSVYNGTTYYFCSATCKSKFDANPENYITLPVANFSTNISKGNAPLYVQFTDHSENANGVSWDFDSNEVIDSTDRNPIHEYAVPGTYKVNLTAVNAKGINSTFATINVSDYVVSSEVLDVVCKMTINKNTAEFTSNYKGTTYYFCSADCKTKFDADPEKYVGS